MKDRIQDEQTAALPFSPTGWGRVSVGVIFTHEAIIAPLLTFPHRGERNRVTCELFESLISLSLLRTRKTISIQER